VPLGVARRDGTAKHVPRDVMTEIRPDRRGPEDAYGAGSSCG
jgi:hypothetical protein